MSVASKLVGFGFGCAVLFAASLGIGRLVGPVSAQPAESVGHAGMEEMSEVSHHGAVGLEASSEGYTLTLSEPRLGPGRQRLAFTVSDAEGAPVTAYDARHERDLHLVVVRRDLTGFQHVHPVLDRATGEWSTDVDLTAGAWRVLADFAPAGSDPLVLGTDLLVPGDFTPEPLGADRQAAHVDGYDVTLGREVVGAGQETVLTATVFRDGKPVTDLQPYLGAYGHLVSLRDGDVGYLHVHPDEDTGPGPAIAFHSEFPTAGRYRLFLDFRHGDAVHTATFTLTVEGGHDH
jgi:hypothetical protein